MTWKRPSIAIRMLHVTTARRITGALGITAFLRVTTIDPRPTDDRAATHCGQFQISFDVGVTVVSREATAPPEPCPLPNQSSGKMQATRLALLDLQLGHGCLPLDSIDAMSLQTKLREIGRAEAEQKID